jgi:D-tyrosyl-tRNA(Tyr) deacylase
MFIVIEHTHFHHHFNQSSPPLPVDVIDSPPFRLISPMRAVLQRVSQASVLVEGSAIAVIGPGLLLLLGVEEGDTSAEALWLAGKVSSMRIFDDGEGRMNLSLRDTKGEALVVSQFTLHASTKKGNRPSFLRAAKPEVSQPLYLEFCQHLEAALEKPVSRGQFGAMMEVSLINNGPVTIVIDSRLRE